MVVPKLLGVDGGNFKHSGGTATGTQSPWPVVLVPRGDAGRRLVFSFKVPSLNFGWEWVIVGLWYIAY